MQEQVLAFLPSLLLFSSPITYLDEKSILLKPTGRGCQTLLFGVWLLLVKKRTKSGQEQPVPCFRKAEFGI
ncbi:MAG: hypothetical protein D3903_08510 [Candidatus Electrothrix sp. GM3_4]|nr:hypothetical protein [Candidatus Electrothrix sp. GM3_4]